MSVKRVNLLWKSFKGLRSLNSINSAEELGADVCANVILSKEKSGQNRSIKSSGWFSKYIQLSEPVIRLFSANMSSYGPSNQLIAFTKTSENINAWIIEDDTGILEQPLKIASFPLEEDVTDVTMVQFGDRLVVACAFRTNWLGFIGYFGSTTSDWTDAGNGFRYLKENITENTTGSPVAEISSIVPYGSRLAINGHTTYTDDTSAEKRVEAIYGIWFSEAGNPINFNSEYITSASDTSAFFVESSEYVNKLVEYNGLTAGCRNHTFNVSGTKVSDYRVQPMTSKGVFGNAMFVMNGYCAYVDGYANNIFVMRGEIDGTIGFDSPIGDDIQELVKDVQNVTINAIGRRVRIMTESGLSLVYDVDISEWTTERFNAGSRVVTFLGKEIMCDGTDTLQEINLEWQPNSQQLPNEQGYYSHYKTNLIWLDSQTSVKSHIYPFGIVLKPDTNNDFFVRFTTDRGETFQARVTKAGFANIATYSSSDEVPANGSKFVADDDDLSGRVFLATGKGELLVTVDRPPFWRYLQIEIYTTTPTMQFNIAGIEAKNTFVDDEQLDY